MKKLYYTVPVIIFTLILILMPEESISYTKNGLVLFTTVVLPAVFPFMVASGILIRCGAVKAIARFLTPVTRFLFGTNGYGGYCLTMSLISGYPMGAVAISELWQHRLISSRQAEEMTAFASSAGPLFILAAVGKGMLDSPTNGYVLLIVHILSTLLCGLCFRAPKSHLSVLSIPQSAYEEPLSSAMKKTVETVFLVGGYIVLFSLISGHIAQFMAKINITAPSLAMGTVTAIIELTCGCASLAHADERLALPLISAALSWGGLSIALQQLSLLTPCGVRASRFFLYRGVQAVLAYTLCSIWLCFTGGQLTNGLILTLLLIAALSLPQVFRLTFRNTSARIGAHTRQCPPRSDSTPSHNWS